MWHETLGRGALPPRLFFFPQRRPEVFAGISCDDGKGLRFIGGMSVGGWIRQLSISRFAGASHRDLVRSSLNRML
jgi:hypothetical protein